MKLEKRNKSKIENHVIEEELDEEFTESTKTLSKGLSKKQYANDEEEKKEYDDLHASVSDGQAPGKEPDEGFFYNHSTGADQHHSGDRRVYGEGRVAKNVSSSDGEANDGAPSSMVNYITKSGLINPLNLKASHQSLYKSVGAEASQSQIKINPIVPQDLS